MFGCLSLSIFAVLGGIALATLFQRCRNGSARLRPFIHSQRSRTDRRVPKKTEKGPGRATTARRDQADCGGDRSGRHRGGAGAERTVSHRILVPGMIIPQGNRLAHVAVKLAGIVAELRKNLGDAVDKDEVLAILESREVADAKSEYLAGRLTNDLQQDLFERHKALWDKKISTEQQFLRSRNQAAILASPRDATNSKQSCS